MKKVKLSILGLSLLALSITIYSCNKDDDTTETTQEDVSITSVVQEVYNYDNGVTVNVDADVITVTGTGLPDHKTPYWDIENQAHELYEPFPTYIVTNDIYDGYEELENLFGTDSDGNTTITYRNNPNNEITVIDYVMEIPTNPTEAINKTATDLGVIGLALNGVPIYNNYEGPSVLGALAMNTFDQAGAHPGPGTDYHYHTAAQLGIYTVNDGSLYPTVNDSKLIGFLRDGFPIYGRQDADGTYPDDLDENGGHIGVTADFADGIYHYHCSSDNYLDSGWYVLKSGDYHGEPGNVSY